MRKSNYLIFTLLLISTTAFAQVDYASQIQPIFNASCTSCHGTNGGVTLTSFEALMGSTGNAYGSNLVVAGDPDASGLVDKIEPNPTSGSRMPIGGTLLQSEIDLIRQWITEGANAVATNNEVESITPESFKLLGNYPNPFNPSTQIQFDVPVATQYTISVYTIHGQLIAEQVGNVAAGRAQVPMNLAGNPTGIYLYKVTALTNTGAQLIGTGRMTLIK
ncbi:MAG: hypothetical protein BalsKO_24460 [Balneolaceae bacterium]